MAKILTLFILLSSSVNAFAQHKIIDAETKEAVSFAHIKLAQQARGTFANFEGVFYLDTIFNNRDSIVISCIGYESRTILIEDIKSKPTISLRPNQQHLSQVTVIAKKGRFQTKKLGIKRKHKGGFTDAYGTAKNGEQKASWIPNEYAFKGSLKSINVFVTDLGYPDAHFRVHVYDCDLLELKPGKELTKSNIIASGTKGNEWVKIDMSAEQIEIGENGCFIGIEWFDSPKSEFFNDTLYYQATTYREGKYKDTTYTRTRSGNGAVIGSIYKPYRFAKNKYWSRKEKAWRNFNLVDEEIHFVPTALPGGRTFNRTPDNSYFGLLCINIDVAFPKSKIKSIYETPKKRSLNRIEKVKQDLIRYPQSSVSELFSSLVKAFESDEVIYVLKYLCVYKEDQLEEILADLRADEEEEKYSFPEKERLEIIRYLKGLEEQMDSSSLEKVDHNQFELKVGGDLYQLIVEKGLWKINPYTYQIYK